MVKSRFPSQDAILCLELLVYSVLKILGVSLLANSHVATCSRSLFISFCKSVRLYDENVRLVSSPTYFFYQIANLQ